MSRIKCQERQHIVYELTVEGCKYIGTTNVEEQLGIEGSLARRVAKHWYRLKDTKRNEWTLYKAIKRACSSKHDIERTVLAVCANKAEAHSVETQLIAQRKPALNSDV